MGISQRDNLAGIGRVRKNLLITGHGGIENHLADCLTGNTNGLPFKQGSVF